MLRPVTSRKACSAWPSTLQLGGRSIAPASSLSARSSSQLRLITRPSGFSASASVIGATARRFKSSSSTPKRPSPSSTSSSSSSSSGSKTTNNAKSSSTRNKMGPAAAAAASKSSTRFTTPPSATSASFDEMSLFPPNLAAGGAPTRKLGRPTIYHYPRSKSSYGAIRLLEACSLKPIIIDITVDPLLPRDVERIMAELGIDHPRDFMRTSDPLYAELNLHDPALGRDALVQAIIDHPRLMKRPVVELPFREQGQRRHACVIAQPPQKLFSVILSESEEEALGFATPRSLDETEADRWARQWSQAEGQLQLDPEQVAEMRAQLADPDESYEFPEETDEIGEDDELPFAIDDDVEAAVSDDIDEAELHRFLREEGLEDEVIIDHTDNNALDEASETPDAADHRQQRRRRRNDDADPEFAAKVNAIILEMAKKAVEEEEREPRNNNSNTKKKTKHSNVTAEEMTELLERIMEVAPPPPPRQRPGRRRLPIPPLKSK